MKILKSTINRYNDIYYINVDISVVVSTKYDNCSILFKNENNIIYVVSSTNGYITNNTIMLAGGHKSLTVSLEHRSNIEDIECFVSYYSNGDLIEFDSEIISLYKTESISQNDVYTAKVNGADTNIFEKRIQTFSDILNKKQGTCSVHVDVKEDIVITVLSSPKKNIYLSFGEITTNIRSSDVIFLLYKGIKKIVIPKEVIWKLYKEYSNNARLGCCEIVSPSFCSIKNVYYKAPVSNVISVSDVPRIIKTELQYFKDPLNRYLNAEKWYIGSANLPIYRDTE